MQRIYLVKIIILFLIYHTLLLHALGQKKGNYAHEQTLFFISDYFSEEFQGEAYTFFKQKVSESSQPSIIIFGSQIPKNGISDLMEEKINFIKNNTSKAFVIPSKEDWNNYKYTGQKNIEEQEFLIDSLLGNEFAFIPENGCPGPAEIHLSENLLLIAIDPISWTAPSNRADEEYFEHRCELEDDVEFYMAIDDAIKRNPNKTIILTSYFPLYSKGKHGGKFPFKTHIFPLTEAWDKCYIPLPLIGTSYIFYRKLIGNIDDLSNYNYGKFKHSLKNIVENEQVIICSGLEKNFQFHEKDSSYHANIASLTQKKFVKTTSNANFTAKDKGYAQINISKAGDTEIVFWDINGNQLFEYSIPKNFTKSKQTNKQILTLKSDTVTCAISKQYHASKFKTILMGKNYRDAWGKEVKFPVFKINEQYEGLRIVKRGGGQQTRSYRLEAKDESQLVLRSVNKFTERALPDDLKKTIAAKAVQDQISASFPYAAPIVAKFADIAGVYHTNPRLVYVPLDSNLGIYNEEMAKDVYLYEERPDEEWRNCKSFGNPEKIVGTPKVLEKIQKDNDNEVDQYAVLRARLFDVWINDWDRHDDQWRWSAFKKEKGWIYRPIPRDRDQAFFLNEGIIPWLASRKWALRKIQGFENNTKDIPGLIFNARHFDHTFLNEPSLSEWIAMADSLKNQLPDSTIEEVVRTMPIEIYELYGKEIITKLKKRRDNLDDFAKRFYLFISKNVEVVGSNKHELFNINRLNNDSTSIEVFKIKKDGTVVKPLYQRVFDRSVTQEIIVYGLDGNDVFNIHGVVKKGIKIRIVGGDGVDTLCDYSNVKGMEKELLFYDQKGENYIKSTNDCKLKLKKTSEINLYDRKSHKYNVLKPILDAGLNKDDGISYGVGIGYIKHGFRKEPYASYQKFIAQITSRSKAYQFLYQGNFMTVFCNTNLIINAKGQFPNFTQNFFGFGNETNIENNDLDYYKIRWESIGMDASIQKNLSENTTISLGSFIELIDIEEREDNFYLANHPDFMYDSSLFEDFHYSGTILNLTFDSRNNKYLPKHGMYLNLRHKYYQGIHKNYDAHQTIKGETCLYKSFKNSDRAVFAFRFGGSLNIGDYKLFHANIIGGKTNLRGFRNERFYGDYSAYQNSELRLRLFNFSNYFIKGKSGIILFNDFGRVWVKNENSKIWHHGYGGGFWIAPFKKTVINANYGLSKEANLLTLKFHYLF